MLTQAFRKALEMMLQEHAIDTLAGTDASTLTTHLCEHLSSLQKMNRVRDIQKRTHDETRPVAHREAVADGKGAAQS